MQMKAELRADIASMLRTQFTVGGRAGQLIPAVGHTEEVVNMIASLIAHHHALDMDEAERAGMLFRNKNITGAAVPPPVNAFKYYSGRD